MNKALKWILYVLLGIIILAVVAGIVISLLGFGRLGYTMMQPGFHMMEPFRYYVSPFRAIFGGLLGLGIFILVIVGIVWLITALVRGNRPYQTQTPSQVAAPAKSCSNCGKPVQEEWKNCPYCGNPLT